jgi:hypothetical protein
VKAHHAIRFEERNGTARVTPVKTDDDELGDPAALEQ